MSDDSVQQRIYGPVEKDLDKVVYASNFMHEAKYLKNPLGWYKVGIKEQLEEAKKPKLNEKIIFNKRKKERIYEVEKLLGISKNDIEFLDHHLCHVAASYYCSEFPKNKKILAISSDGSGELVAGNP